MGSLKPRHPWQPPRSSAIGALAITVTTLGIVLVGSAASLPVLCRGLDGHLAFEWSKAGQCVEELGGAQDGGTPSSSAPIQPSRLAAGDRCCGPCNDAPLMIGAAPLLSATPSDASNLSFSGHPAFSTPPVTSASPPGRFELKGTLTSLPSASSLARIRTVVTRC